MKKINEQIRQGALLVSDGAWGTLLQKKGMQPGECPELWCVEHRGDVLDIARAYVAAGADLIESNSFGGTRFKLEHYGLERRVEELNEAAASISRAAAGADRHVIASVGPTGKLLLMGDVTEAELYDAFREQLVALERGGADACCIETMTALDEAVLAIKAACENTCLEVLCTLSFARTADGHYHTMMGVSPADMAASLVAAGADIIGANCGMGPEHMVEVVQEIRAVAPDVPVMVQPNAGMPRSVDGVDVFPDSPESMAERVPDLVRAGANIIGGCCGTTPAHIAAIAAAVRRYGVRRP